MVSICLNMIVKNESHIICKTFDNILKYVPITYWVISDTGSTDNTIELIKGYWKEKNIDGELVEHAWKDFGHNRTKSLESAYNKTDYLLIFDADDSFHGDFKLPAVLDKDSYNLKFGEGFEYVRPLLINNRRRWKFVGVLHEFLSCCEPNAVSATIDGDYHVESGRTGNRSQDPKKYEKDAKVLEMACQTETDTSLTDRYAFYCAQSWKDAGEPDNSISWYKKCLTLNNWYQEKYYSCLMIGNLYKQKGDMIEALKYWLKTTEYDGERMEGIAEAIQFLRESGMNLFVCALYKKYKGYNKRPNDKLFIDITKYDSVLEYNASISAYYCGKKEMGMECCRKLLMDTNASPSSIFATFGNIQFYDVKPDATLFERVDELICSLSRAGHSIPQSAFELWNKLIHKDQLTKYSPIKNKKPSKSPKIILTMTTCKRFDLFQQTVNSITNTWTDIDMIDYWFCVDDNSSPEDRNQMKKKYNWIDYYMKGPEEKGHRQSMNIIWDKINELRPTYWIHMEDDFRFHCRMDYIKTGIKYLEGNIKQVLFNRNYGEQIKDYSISGHAPFGATQEIVLHDHKSGSFNYPNCHYWTDYSFRPSIIKVDAILELGNYNSANQFFEKDYADRWYGAGFRSAFFNKITCEHIGKLTSDKTGANAYTMNDESQFVKTDLKEVGRANKIKVVNLLRRTDRRDNVIQKFKGANITNYEFIEAVDGKKIATTPEIRKLFTGNDFGNRRGVIGCALSHYNLWKQLINDTAEYYIIMEDDFELCENFQEKMNKIKLEDYELIFFGYHMFENERNKVKYIYNVESEHTAIEKLNKNLYIGATHCYSINRKGAIKILEYIAMNGIKHGIDYLMKISNLDCYESRPHLAFAEWNENGKNIDTDIQNNSDSMNLNEDISQYFDFVPNRDQIGNDLYYNRKSLDEMMAIAYNDKNCAGFNTLGFFKNNIENDKLTTSPYFSSKDGIYIKRSFEKHTIEKIYEQDANIMNDVFIESGAFVGGGIECALRLGFKEIHSIELAEKYYNICRQKFKNYPNVHVHHGDSGVLLPKILEKIDCGVTFWLDGHYSSLDTACANDYVSPIQLELDAIKKYNNKDHVVMIDDMKDFTVESIVWNNNNNKKCGYITKDDLEVRFSEIFEKYRLYYSGPACVCYSNESHRFKTTTLRNIFIYWVGHEYKLIKILRRIMELNSTKGVGYNLVLINEKNIYDYIDVPHYFRKLQPAHQADYLRVNVLCEFGGIWLDSDTILMDSLDTLFDIFEKKDGFFIRQNNETIWNGIFGTKPNTALMKSWKEDIKNILDTKKDNIEWEEIGNKYLQNKYETTDYFCNYEIFNGLDTVYPVNWNNCYMEFLNKPYDNYKTIIREYQPFVVLVNSVYKAYESMSELNTPLHYFIDKAFKNMTHLIDYKFVEIGTSNFDTLIETANDDDYGLTVEPLSVYLHELPNKKNVKKINMAATDIPKTKNINMYYIPETIIKENNLPEWFKGCNTIGDYHPLHKKHNVEKFVRVESVELISVSRLFYSNNIRGLEYMKIDTEGHDCIILRGLYEYLRYLPDNFHPREIKFESNEHTNLEDVDNIISLYESFDYYLVSRDYDTVLKKIKKIKLLCNWGDSESVCAQWNRYNTEKGIRFTSKNPDYYVIVNHPINNEYYEADKTIVFQMEPWVYDESKKWGVKTWGEWARPDESKFLKVYKEKNLFVNSQNANIKQNKINKIVSICSRKNQDTGHILRNNFIRRMETEINGKTNYFVNMLKQCNNDSNNLVKYIVNPLMGYYICDLFLGDDWKEVPSIIPDAQNILNNRRLKIKENDILYVQVNYFQDFCVNILPTIDKKFILITGQFHNPQIFQSELTSTVLNNPYLIKWFSQNPLFEHPKYEGFPYGIFQQFLPNYYNALLKNNGGEKNNKIANLFVTKNNNPERNIIPDVPKDNLDEYYEKLSQSEFILSPAGDRAECYRHWEAIGLKTIPIANVPETYKQLFTNNMEYVSSVKEMVDLLERNNLIYNEPNRDIISVEYWKDKINNCKTGPKMINVFGRDNYHNFSSYVGQLEDDKTYNGYSKYKYAFTAENNAEDNYATEKIYEPIMCECLCFYWGCPNLEEFLNPMAFVRLDLNDLEGSIAIVKKAIEEDWWSERIDVIRKEKERIMKDLNFFKKMEDIIESRE